MGKPKKPVRYCERCGSKCDIAEIRHGYDRDTGKPVVEYLASCPTIMGRFFRDGHTRNVYAGGHQSYIYDSV